MRACGESYLLVLNYFETLENLDFVDTSQHCAIEIVVNTRLEEFMRD